jgi:multidrug transporter EmrE-like cation transporter
MFSSFFLIRALDFLPTAVVFPVYSAGSMALILILSRVLYGEKLSARHYGAIGMTMIALVMINLG